MDQSDSDSIPWISNEFSTGIFVLARTTMHQSTRRRLSLFLFGTCKACRSTGLFSSSTCYAVGGTAVTALVSSEDHLFAGGVYFYTVMILLVVMEKNRLPLRPSRASSSWSCGSSDQHHALSLLMM